MTYRALLAQLVQAGLLPEAERAAVAEALLTPGMVSPATSWILRVLSGVGAWLAGFFVIGAVASCLALLDIDKDVLLVGGPLLMLASVAVHRLKLPLFVSQLAQSVALVGLLSWLFAAHDLAPIELLAIGLGALFFVLDPDPFLRFCYAITVIGATESLLQGQDMANTDGVVLLSLVLVGGSLALPWPSVATPLRWGAMVGLFTWLIFGRYQGEPLLLSGVASGGALIGIGLWLLSRYRYPLLSEIGGLVVIAPVLLTLLTLGRPGVPASLFAMAAAFAARDRLLLIVASVGLFGFGVSFYYDLQLDLVEKAGVLISSGALLLGLRKLLQVRGVLA